MRRFALILFCFLLPGTAVAAAPQVLPSDPMFGQSWALHNTGQRVLHPYGAFTDDASIAALDAAQTPDDVLAVLGDVSA